MQKLKDMLNKNNLFERSIMARQHYLRWDTRNTWRYYEEAGINYDMTLTYADHIGFRCGV